MTHLMGIALWLVSGLAAFALARFLPLGKRRTWAELAAAVLAALGLGVLATALDFGGWQEPDWRAAAFAFCGALACAGLVRVFSADRKAQQGRAR